MTKKKNRQTGFSPSGKQTSQYSAACNRSMSVVTAREVPFPLEHRYHGSRTLDEDCLGCRDVEHLDECMWRDIQSSSGCRGGSRSVAG